MAEIFKAKTFSQGGFESLLVIKRILPHVGANEDFVEMFIDEAKVSVALQHPNVVRVFDFGQILDDYFIAMECVEGKDVRNLLRKHVKQGKQLPVEFAAYIAHETCKGLHYAHTKTDHRGNPYGIIHRDISPSNVLVGYDAQVKIADFGIAKAESNAYQTRDGVLKGKFEYMSPEQAEGKPLDPRSDVFAVGILLWESLTGHRLFKTDSDLATLRAIQSADVPLPSSVVATVPPALEQIAMRALSRDPADRFPTAAAMADALRSALAPDTPDSIRERFGAYLEGFFATEIAEERDRLEANSELALRLREEVPDWDGQTTSMRPVTVIAGPRIWPVMLLLAAVLVGTVGLAVVGMAVVVGWQAEEAVTLGDVDVVVDPDARVYVDGLLRGTGSTVLVSRLEPGEHEVRLEADGYVTETLRIEVSVGDALRVEQTLQPVPDPPPDAQQPAKPTPTAGTKRPIAKRPRIRLDSTPSGAVAYVDGKRVGSTPTTYKASVGQEVVVRFELEGRETVEGTITAGEAGSTQLFSRTLPEASRPGKLTVLLVGGGWANVFVDGVKLPKTAPLRDVEISPGTHEIRVSNEGLGVDHIQSITVGSGAAVTVRASPQ